MSDSIVEEIINGKKHFYFRGTEYLTREEAAAKQLAESLVIINEYIVAEASQEPPVSPMQEIKYSYT